MVENSSRKALPWLIVLNWPWIYINLSGKHKPKYDSLQSLQILSFRFAFAVQVNYQFNQRSEKLLDWINLIWLNCLIFFCLKNLSWWCKNSLCGVLSWSLRIWQSRIIKTLEDTLKKAHPEENLRTLLRAQLYT